jgi:hypothetical protein
MASYVPIDMDGAGWSDVIRYVSTNPLNRLDGELTVTTIVEAEGVHIT